MRSEVLHTQLKGLAARPSRLLLTAIAIAVATAFAYGTVLAQAVVTGTVVGALSETPQEATTVVMPQDERDRTPAEVARVTAAPGVTTAAPRTTAYVQVGGVARGDAGFYDAIEGDPGSGPLSRVAVEEGTYPRTAAQVAVTESFARSTGAGIGDRLTLLPDNGAQRRVVEVTAVVDPESAMSGAVLYGQPGDVAAMRDGRGYWRVDLVATDEAALREAAGAVQWQDGPTRRQ